VKDEQVGLQFFGVGFAKGYIVAAEYDFCHGPGVSNGLNHFFDTGVPVCHCRLDEDEIARRFLPQEIFKHISAQAVAAEVPRNVRQGRRIGNDLLVEPASAPAVGLEAGLVHCEWMEPVEKIEEPKFCFTADEARDA